MVMRVHWFQHVPFEGLGCMEEFLAEAGAEVRVTRWFAGDQGPRAEDFDFLIVMGGPMGVSDEEDHPWLETETRVVREAIATGKRVLGICLGAQLIAKAMGAEVGSNGAREIGWFPVTVTAPAGTHFLTDLLIDGPEVFHWHGDRFEIPEGAMHVAASAGCPHQAFAMGDRAVGLQFHLETTPESARALIANCGDELDGSRYVQDPEEMLSRPDRFEAANALMRHLLEYLMKDA